MNRERGESLIEVIIAATVGILVVSALTFATIFSLRNASFAKNSAQATKLAQEGIEKVRSIRDRDRDGSISTDIVYPPVSPPANISKFSELYSVDLSHAVCNTVAGDMPCYFRFDASVLTKVTDRDFETLGSFKRQIMIGDQFSPDTTGSEKTVTVIVRWTDAAGDHDSKLTTILRKL